MAFFSQTCKVQVFRFFPKLKVFKDMHANQCPLHVFLIIVTLNESLMRKVAKMINNVFVIYSEGTREHQNWALAFQRLSNFKLHKNAPQSFWFQKPGWNPGTGTATNITG